MFSEGLHVLGQKPSAEQIEQYLSAYFEGMLNESCIQAIASGVEDVSTLVRYANSVLTTSEGEEEENDDDDYESYSSGKDDKTLHLVTEALDITARLQGSDEEMKSVLTGLSGQFIPPAMGGDLLRDGKGVLPTGRNIYALDPYRMPSPGG